MGCFPFFVDIEGAKGVIVGGGKVAARKAEKLIPFGPALTVIAPGMDDHFFRLEKMLAQNRETGAKISLVQRKLTEEDLADAAFVIAATDDEAVNGQISEYCRKHRIPVNVVDDREKCTFFFPALAKDGPLTVGISTDGKSPAAAAYVRKEIEQKLPDGMGKTVELLGQLRPEVMELCDDQSERANILEKLFWYCLRREGDVTFSELRGLLHGMR